MQRNLKRFIALLALPVIIIAAILFFAVSPLAGLAGLVVGGFLYYILTPQVLHLLGVHPHYTGRTFDLTGKKALIIGTNHEDLGDTGMKTGVALSELSVPYYQFLDANMEVDLSSPKGGKIPIDPQTIRWPIPTPYDKRFLKDVTAMDRLNNSLNIEDLDFKDYDIVFMAGGWGASYDLGQSEVLGEKTTEAYANNAIVGSVCHGALGLLNVKDENGKSLLEGRNATGVTDKQIRELGISITPLPRKLNCARPVQSSTATPPSSTSSVTSL
ncbi:MAG: type 1 glutamine amidotransferase domain-containing protein [Chloroflexota bacterium]